MEGMLEVQDRSIIIADRPISKVTNQSIVMNNEMNEMNEGS
jgi:hypothetical protein